MTTTSVVPKSGIELIKRFEGCKLKAYPDPDTGGVPWTIGWGSTRNINGQPFRPGDTITAAEADTLLDDSIGKYFWPQVQKLPYFSEMSDEQRGAILSFAYNLGANWYGGEKFTTISRLIRNKDWDKVPDALVLYRNPGSGVEEGLKRRRIAEGALWSRGLQKFKSAKRVITAKQDTLLKKEPLQGFELSEGAKIGVARGRSYTIVDSLDEGSHTRVTLDYSAGTWYVYTPHWDIAVPGKPVVSDSNVILLNVPYYTQLDSATSHAQRKCFTSTNAMAAEYLKPGCLGGGNNPDDTFLTRHVFKYGDTTNPIAQVRALADLGIKAAYRQDMSRQDIIDQLRKGIPVPAGYLHRGPVGRPSGGGHWCLIIGIDLDKSQYIVNDPYGDCDLIHGGFPVPSSGARVRYSFRHLEPRWMVEGPKTGWGLILSRG